MFWDVLVDLLSQSVSGQAAPECSAFFYCSDWDKKKLRKRIALPTCQKWKLIKKTEKIENNKRQKVSTFSKRYQQKISSGKTNQSPFDVLFFAQTSLKFVIRGIANSICQDSSVSWTNLVIWLFPIMIFSQAWQYSDVNRSVSSCFFKIVGHFFQLMEVDENFPKGSWWSEFPSNRFFGPLVSKLVEPAKHLRWRTRKSCFERIGLRYTPPRIHGWSKYESDERRTASEAVIVLHAPGLPQQLTSV